VVARQRCLQQILVLEDRDHEPAFVEPLPTGAPRHLQVVARLHVVHLHTVELAQQIEHHRARRHVDAECERLGGEQHLQQT
jgi:hypothetical protein